MSIFYIAGLISHWCFYPKDKVLESMVCLGDNRTLSKRLLFDSNNVRISNFPFLNSINEQCFKG